MAAGQGKGRFTKTSGWVTGTSPVHHPRTMTRFVYAELIS
jgi:hypothetical protein